MFCEKGGREQLPLCVGGGGMAVAGKGRLSGAVTFLIVAGALFYCGSLLCHGTAEKMEGVTSGCAKPHLLEGS